ncbi:alpha/beta hydrolase [Actinophytocola oryzae]|uniref:Alpha/beta hydrolase family protein n=1 Tax=Actinophytocola oryzae TaxID=502181 RepID=A0A4R7UVD0_9PSEU|nr:alpha/beta hydrolase [Actinophytocola oryzae]TDV37545.1 alpha/beta hydrolase family protein [Actinophytocola oryzae]
MVTASILLVFVAGACTTSVDGEPGAKLPITVTNAPKGPVPQGLEKFYSQGLTWDSCDGYAKTDYDRQAMRSKDLQCTHLTVPLDYAKPDGDTVKLGVLRRPARKSSERIGSLVINPGGPGAAGLSTAAALADANDTLADRFDFVGFDPRGVGSSEPNVECLTDQEMDAERADDAELDVTPAGVRKQEDEAKSFGQECEENTKFGPGMLANIGTRDVAKDLDILRSALGDEKLTYLGYSYGTRIGSTYAETFPNNVRALVLDGALDPSQSPVDEVVAQGAGFQKAFDDFVAWCVKQDDCALGKDQNGALKAFQDLVRPLAKNPVQVSDGRRLSYEDATTGVVQALYSEQLWDRLNSGLTGLKQNDGDTLMQLADLYMERDSDGEYSTTQDVFTAVRCVDDPRITDPNEALEVARQYKAAAPFLDDGNPPVGVLDACAYWPVPNTSEPHVPNVPGLPKVLVVSTTNDPATPYEAGVALAKGLGGGLLTYEATQHTAFLQGNKCVDEAGVKYLTDLQLPKEGTRCKP